MAGNKRQSPALRQSRRVPGKAVRPNLGGILATKRRGPCLQASWSMARRARIWSADLLDRDVARQPSSSGGGLDDLEGVHAGLGGDGILAVSAAGRQEGRQLDAQGLRAARRQLVLARIDGFPRAVALAVLTRVQDDGGLAVVGDERAALTDDHAFAVGA